VGVGGLRPDPRHCPRDRHEGPWNSPRGRVRRWPEPLAEAFLTAGFDAYIGATEPYVDADSTCLFAYGFFYFALLEIGISLHVLTPIEKL
jgi:hypothetical protein